MNEVGKGAGMDAGGEAGANIGMETGKVSGTDAGKEADKQEFGEEDYKEADNTVWQEKLFQSMKGGFFNQPAAEKRTGISGAPNSKVEQQASTMAKGGELRVARGF